MFTPVKIVRLWLPGLIFVVGAAMLIISPDIVGVEGAALMLGGGLGVVVSNRIHQIGLRGERDRDEEMGARAFLSKYGVWPDEASEEVLARAERAGDILPRTPPAPRPGGSAHGPAEDGVAAADGGDDAATSTSAAPAEAAGHPHAGGRRTARASRRPPRR